MKIQLFTVWLLPLIVLGGMFFPPLGYLVFLMMLFFLPFSYFRGRQWCGKICPRGAFLDIVLSRFSVKVKVPDFMHKNWFKLAVFFSFMIFFISQFVVSEKNFNSFGFVFVRMCLLSTLVAITLGIPFHQRIWCVFCPMGFLQSKIRSLNKGK
jgi:ferredoxin-type protein NapH